MKELHNISTSLNRIEDPTKTMAELISYSYYVLWFLQRQYLCEVASNQNTHHYDISINNTCRTYITVLLRFFSILPIGKSSAHALTLPMVTSKETYVNNHNFTSKWNFLYCWLFDKVRYFTMADSDHCHKILSFRQ